MGTRELVPFVKRPFEWGVGVATFLSVLSHVPCRCARLTDFLHPKLRKVDAVLLAPTAHDLSPAACGKHSPGLCIRLGLCPGLRPFLCCLWGSRRGRRDTVAGDREGEEAHERRGESSWAAAVSVGCVAAWGTPKRLGRFRAVLPPPSGHVSPGRGTEANPNGGGGGVGPDAWGLCLTFALVQFSGTGDRVQHRQRGRGGDRPGDGQHGPGAHGHAAPAAQLRGRRPLLRVPPPPPVLPLLPSISQPHHCPSQSLGRAAAAAGPVCAGAQQS